MVTEFEDSKARGLEKEIKNRCDPDPSGGQTKFEPMLIRSSSDKSSLCRSWLFYWHAQHLLALFYRRLWATQQCTINCKQGSSWLCITPQRLPCASLASSGALTCFKKMTFLYSTKRCCNALRQTQFLRCRRGVSGVCLSGGLMPKRFKKPYLCSGFLGPSFRTRVAWHYHGNKFSWISLGFWVGQENTYTKFKTFVFIVVSAILDLNDGPKNTYTKIPKHYKNRVFWILYRFFWGSKSI